jgi:hypothetical protein
MLCTARKGILAKEIATLKVPDAPQLPSQRL